ncbi:MAG: hypothetical protein A2Y53_01885, partial [Chloroflexi bacterium RBG_16_47_49]
AEVCDGADNNCDGQTDEGVLNACGACGPVPVEVCDSVDNDCDGQTDENCIYPAELPRTWQTTCYDTAGTVISCAGTGQDGELQAGVPWPSPRFTDNGDDTVTDNLTGLMWTKRADPLSIGYMRWEEALYNVSLMNSSIRPNFGYTDWRLPNINEMTSLIDAERSSPALAAGHPFINVIDGNMMGTYWSSTTNAGSIWEAFILNMYDGDVINYSKALSSFPSMWPVRSSETGIIQLPKTGQKILYVSGDDGQLQKGFAWPSPRFIDNSNGKVTDNLTGLTWVKDANLIATRDPGFDADDVSGDGLVTWQHALNYIAKLNTESYLGHTDWRLPNLRELQSLIDRSRSNPVIPQEAMFTNMQGGYWSSTSGDYVSSKDGAYILEMLYGRTYAIGKHYASYYIWPVRGGQTIEICDGVDNDGDGLIDEAVQNTYYQDADGDTYGNSSVTMLACTQPAAYVSNSSDCNDSNASVNPGAVEVCNAVDDNCDGNVDEGCANNTPAGTNITVTPTPATTLIFDNVNTTGNTTVTTSGTGAPPPSGFNLGNQPLYYEITTTALFTGMIKVCFNYDESNYGNENLLSLFHLSGSVWENITIAGYPDTTNNIICGYTTSLSPFIIAEEITPEICDGIDNNGNGQIDEGCNLSADLSISHSDLPDPVTPAGQDVTYTITVTNNGPGSATGVTVTDVLDASLTLVSVTPSQGDPCTGTGTITCNLGTILNGSSATVAVVATTGTTPGMIGSTASVTAIETDPNTANNSSMQTTNVGDISREVGISTRGYVGTLTEVMVGGFSFDGNISKKVLIRGRGPFMSGAPYNFTGTLADPILEIYSGQGLIVVIDNWQNGPVICSSPAICEIVSAPNDPCQPNVGQTTAPPGCMQEAALYVTLPPGAYTAKLKGVNNNVGKGIIEVYDADTVSLTMLGGISTRGKVLTGTDVMVGGFIIGAGSTNKTLLLRGRGPSLSGAPYNFTGTLSNPSLEVYSGTTLFATVDDWQSGATMCNAPAISCGTPAQLQTALVDPCQPNVGQTTAPPGCTQESAMFITLPPGAYTAKLKGVNNDTGIGIFEVYEMTP